MFNNEFYPTPATLAKKMARMVNIDTIESVLEPSAGNGNLAAAIAERMNVKRHKYRRNDEPVDFEGLDIDTIEIEPDLRHVLKGHGIRVVHDDFMTFQTFKRYSLILMNPPFSEGARHLLKALDMQQDGGQIVCILNAETLKNPCTNERRELQTRLTDYAAKVEFIQDAFRDAERKTYVEIALIHVNIERKPHASIIFDNLKKAQEIRREQGAESGNQYGALIDNDFVGAKVQQFNFEVRAGLKLIDEYEAMRPYILDSLNDKGEPCGKPILTLEIVEGKYDKSASPNKYIRKVRAKYWQALFDNDKFTGRLTSNLRSEYHSQISKFADYDFTAYNIYTVLCDMNAHMIQGVEDTILNLFDELSRKHSWYDETSKNIHYYNGWATNKAWKINKKVIIPLRGFSSWSDRPDYDYSVHGKLSDIEKVFNYLDGGLTESVDLRRVLNVAQAHGETKKIECKYFYVDFFKKGTCHITFKNLELLEVFNIYGSQRKGWLPPTYGKKAYQDMTKEEKAVVDEFQGAAAYSKTMRNPDYYLFNAANIPQLDAAQASA